MRHILVIFAMTASLTLANPSQAKCEDNVDGVKFFYMNGVSNSWESYGNNLREIREFVSDNFENISSPDQVTGQFNKSENILAEVFEVLGQKYADWSAKEKAAVHDFILGGSQYAKDTEGMATVEKFLKEVGTVYYKQLGEEDALAARVHLRDLMETCSRVIIVTHSQGNFYGNMLMNWAYQHYQYPNGYKLVKYPMLGNMQIASPTYVPGGSVAQVYPGVVDHVTLSNDVAMTLVRGTVGSVPANLNAPFNPSDLSGHSMVNSYLLPPDVAAAISSRVLSILASMEPYPLHGQKATASSAFDGLGYSTISQVLDVHFSTGGVYRYSSVPEGAFNSFWSAASHGTHFNQYIRDQYPYARIEER